MKSIIKFSLAKLSRLIFYIYLIKHYITPAEFKKKFKKLEIKLDDNLADETFNHFKEHLKKSLLFNDY